jgi:maleate isomerase
MGEGYYGRNGTLGLATPQANPTAETEFRALLPEGVGCATVRMASEAPDPEARLRAYFTDIAQTLNRFDTLAMQAVGLACTGSSYLLGHEAVEADLAELSAHREQPIVSAASAIERALAHLGARSIALICPYPQWLLDAADAHWQSRGFEVVDQVSLDPGQGDTRAYLRLVAP